MTLVSYKVDHERVVLSLHPVLAGRFKRFLRYFKSPSASQAREDFAAWAGEDISRCMALGSLRTFGESHPGEVEIHDQEVFASHASLASLTLGEAKALGLPGSPPFSLRTDTTGLIGSSNFKLIAQWQKGGKSVSSTRNGAFLQAGLGEFLISEPIYSMLELVEAFNAGGGELSDHWAALSRFRNLLGEEEASSHDRVEMSGFLKDLEIYTGSALSLALKGDAESPEFDPIIFGAHSIESQEYVSGTLSEKYSLLSEKLQEAFQNSSSTGFKAFKSAKSSYLLAPKKFLILDDAVTKALDVVRKKQQAAPAERRAFVANPRASILEALRDQVSDVPLQEGVGEGEHATEESLEEVSERIFIETPEYADRAFGIGIWEKPSVELPPEEPNTWLPQVFSLDLGGVWVRLERDSVNELRGKIGSAIDANQPEVIFQGKPIPAVPEVREELAQCIGITEPPPPLDKDDLNTALKLGREKTVIRVYENYVEENWSPNAPPRTCSITTDPPKILTTELMAHQRSALTWQIGAWEAGFLGILNADDQGLGKTLQTIAFMAWLQAQMALMPNEKRLPFLVVAPTGLLRTWDAEVEKHTKGGLGARLEVFGSALKRLKVEGLTGMDTDDGEPRLAFSQLESAIHMGNGHKFWLLTTYETLANFQHSFRSITFSLVVFDEIQKVKNIKTLNALAARTVKADFRIGLTGTPIENHILDLWSIMDVIAPGRFGSLKEFQDRYGTASEERFQELSARLFKQTKCPETCATIPPIAQRRMKEGQMQELPRKRYRLYPLTMPSRQADAYEKAREHLLDGSKGFALKVLHHIRGVSLHPDSPEGETGPIESYFRRAARMRALEQILDHIQSDQERVLIYTEDLRMQALLAQWLRSRFGVKARIINGSTSVPQRKKFVEEFQANLQAGPAFDVMVLSPRAAGIGLTLTAATHVVHLSRWWNPAVEEQCNDRIYRIGQQQDVTIHLPLAIHPEYREGSFDCVLNNLMRRKKKLAHAALWPPAQSEFDQGMLVTGIKDVQAIELADIDDMNWEGFENWVLDRARESGDWQVSKTPWTGDGGADAVLRSLHGPTRDVLVQVKHTSIHKHSITESAVREVIDSRDAYQIEGAELVVVTNARGFTESAQLLANKHQVKLIDRDLLGLWPVHVVA